MTHAVALAASDLTARGVVWSGQPSARVASEGVVCFRSRPAMGGAHRSMVHVGSGRYAVPPLTHVTVERIAEPGDWQLGEEDTGPTMCRCYTVLVAW